MVKKEIVEVEKQQQKAITETLATSHLVSSFLKSEIMNPVLKNSKPPPNSTDPSPLYTTNITETEILITPLATSHHIGEVDNSSISEDSLDHKFSARSSIITEDINDEDIDENVITTNKNDPKNSHDTGGEDNNSLKVSY